MQRATVVALLLLSALGAAKAHPAHPQAGRPVEWQSPISVDSRVALGKPDVHTCHVLQPPHSTDAASSVTHTDLSIRPSSAGVQLYKVLLLDCDAAFWQLSGIQHDEHVCLANTAALRAACNQWLLAPPAAGQTSSQARAPQHTAFATAAGLQGRVLVLQAHWRLSQSLTDRAVSLPALQLKLGMTNATSGTESSTGSRPTSSSQVLESADAAASSTNAGPALLGTFVGSSVYPPSSLSHNLQTFILEAPADPAAAGSSSGSIATAKLACGKRCTYLQLGKLKPRPVNVVGYSFTTFDRATTVAFDIRRGAAGRSAGPVAVMTTPKTGYIALDQPFQLHPGDVVQWQCSYNMSGLQPGSSLQGGFSSDPSNQQEQCTVMLHYWPRVDGLKGCSAALLDDHLLGENMCSHEAIDLLQLTGAEAQQFPMRRMYQEHSFPKGSWMGGWKATHIILQMAAIWATLWGSQTLLGSCKALGPIHRRFIQLAPGQQRNVALYITHLLLDTVALGYVFQPMIELWFGWTETTAEVQAGVWGFTYIVACYALELTWRRAIDTMLAIHHIGTITIILLYAGELTAQTYRVANTIIVLAAFALMEQPTYVALLCKRMLPSSSNHVVRAARVGYISWFALKGASVLLAVSMFWEDWHLMPTWIRVNFVTTWTVACLVQGWSGVIQYSIYKHIVRAHNKSRWELKQEMLKRRTAAALSVHHLTGTTPSDDDEAFENAARTAGSLCEPFLLALGPLPLRDSTGASSDMSDCIGAGSDDERVEADADESTDGSDVCLASPGCSTDACDADIDVGSGRDGCGSLSPRS